MSVHLHRCPVEGCRSILVTEPPPDRQEEPATDQEHPRTPALVKAWLDHKHAAEEGRDGYQHRCAPVCADAILWRAFPIEREARVPASLDVKSLLDLLKRAKPHLYAVDRKGWCWCADDNPDRDPGDHDLDCKWIADGKRVGALRIEIENLLSPQPSTEPAQGGTE